MSRLSLAALATAVLLTSCSSDETGPAPPGPIPVESLRSESEAANCEFLVRCGWMPDTPTCKSLDAADFELVQLIGDVGLGKVHYDADAARKWVEALRNTACHYDVFLEDKVRKEFWGPVFTGTVKEGDPCFVDDECAGKNVCDNAKCTEEDVCCGGACVAPPAPVPVGGDCAAEGVTCVEEAFCGVDEGGGGSGGGSGGGGGTGMPVCKPRAGNGQPCVGTQGCQPGQLCDVGGSDKCYKLSPDASPCNPTLATSCLDYNRWCDPAAMNKCVKLPVPGEPCAPTGEHCVRYAFCDGTTCQARPVEGEKCDFMGPACIGDLFCNGVTCSLRPPAQVCEGTPAPGGGSGSGGSGGGGN